MTRLVLALLLALVGLVSAQAQAVNAPKILQWGVGRPTGSAADAVCVYDRAGVCQQIGSLPQSGGPFSLGAIPLLNTTLDQLSLITTPGIVAYCSNCLKPGETTTNGSGIIVFRDANKWNTVAGAPASN